MNDSSSSADIDIAHIAELAHFKLTPDELENLKKDLDSTIQYVQKLFELDVSNVEPTKFGQPVSNVLREDVVEPSLDHDTVIANAPDASDREFRMPKIVE
ncbi:MAG: Asp-tRNA(Asn)/Glu-tRNA(Gln) amidotransferase subunit GatC [Kiritimatiellia bacterium]